MIGPKIPTNAPTRVLCSKITLRWLHKEKKTTNQGVPNAEGSNLHEVPIGQSPPIEPTPAQLAEKEKRVQAERAIQAKKAAAAGKKAAAAATTTIETETLNNLSQLEDDQL